MRGWLLVGEEEGEVVWLVWGLVVVVDCEGAGGITCGLNGVEVEVEVGEGGRGGVCWRMSSCELRILKIGKQVITPGRWVCFRAWTKKKRRQHRRYVSEEFPQREA